MQLVAESPPLPGASGAQNTAGVIAWMGIILRALSQYLTAMAVRVNRVLPKDGTEAMTAPLVLKSYLSAARPTASEWEGGIIYVSDASAGSNFQGSDGSSWVSLG